MANSEVLAIGSVIKHRGEYNNDTVYYTNNQVTMCNSVFQAVSNNFSGVPPLAVTEKQHVQLVNTGVWKCIIDNSALYNAALSINNVERRTTVNEENIKKLGTEVSLKLNKSNIQVLSVNDYEKLSKKDDEALYFLFEEE